MDGLFCERIFGPSKSLECACGKYKRVRYEGLICERCGVELTESRVRRHRMGYINLVYPVTHVWYINSRPNFMALLLEVEEFEKRLDTSYTSHSEAIETTQTIEMKSENLTYEWVNRTLKLTPSTIISLWDERIKRIKLASLAYFIAEDEISFYGLHWDLQQYRRSRELGRSSYPLKPYPKPQNRRQHTPKYLLQATPSFLIGAPLVIPRLIQVILKEQRRVEA